MKRALVLFATAALLVGAAGFSYASGRYDDRPWRDEHRRGGGTYYSDSWYPRWSITFSFPGSWERPHRRHYRPPRRVWVPGHWEYVRVWVPGRTERYWVPGWHGPRDYNPGHYERRHRGGEYRMKKVWREGQYR